jgi:hypothetical protein
LPDWQLNNPVGGPEEKLPSKMKNAPHRVRIQYWCREPESNRHGVTTAGF